MKIFNNTLKADIVAILCLGLGLSSCTTASAEAKDLCDSAVLIAHSTQLTSQVQPEALISANYQETWVELDQRADSLRKNDNASIEEIQIGETISGLMSGYMNALQWEREVSSDFKEALIRLESYCDELPK